MQNPRLASRYAKSLLDLAVERGELEAVYQDMIYLQQVTKGSRDFLNLIKSPVIPPAKKQAVINAVMAGKVGTLMTAFTNLLVAKGRESVLPEMATAFINQYKDKKGIQTIKLTTAAEVSDEVKAAIMAQVRATSDIKDIELEAKVDPALIGGFVLQAGDRLVDASIAYDLKAVSKQFENNDFIYKVR
jgi:F-type H+-transporting ATPase subunit delta